MITKNDFDELSLFPCPQVYEVEVQCKVFVCAHSKHDARDAVRDAFDVPEFDLRTAVTEVEGESGLYEYALSTIPIGDAACGQTVRKILRDKAARDRLTQSKPSNDDSTDVKGAA